MSGRLSLPVVIQWFLLGVVQLPPLLTRLQAFLRRHLHRLYLADETALASTFAPCVADAPVMSEFVTKLSGYNPGDSFGESYSITGAPGFGLRTRRTTAMQYHS